MCTLHNFAEAHTYHQQTKASGCNLLLSRLLVCYCHLRALNRNKPCKSQSARGGGEVNEIIRINWEGGQRYLVID